LTGGNGISFQVEARCSPAVVSGATLIGHETGDRRFAFAVQTV
jgi:hypothetical protein